MVTMNAEERLNKLEKVVFTGNNKPPFTVRIAVIENKIDDLSKVMQKTNNNVEKLTKFMVSENTTKETIRKIDEKKMRNIKIWLTFISGVVIGLASLIINMIWK